jgi:hypothetical protein
LIYITLKRNKPLIWKKMFTACKDNQNQIKIAAMRLRDQSLFNRSTKKSPLCGSNCIIQSELGLIEGRSPDFSVENMPRA